MLNGGVVHSVPLEAGLAGLTEEQVLAVQLEAAKQDTSLAETIVRLGLASEHELLNAAAQRGGFELLSTIPVEDVEEELLSLVSANVASHYGVFPLRYDGHKLILATADPLGVDQGRELGLVLVDVACIEFALAPVTVIRDAIRKAYGVGAATVERMVGAEQTQTTVSNTQDLMDQTEAREATVLNLVNQVLADAIGAGATDIHFEPYEQDLLVRYRIDGVLLDTAVPATVRFLKDGIASRIKVMAGLDIAEKRLPQDGRTQVDLLDSRYDLRVSILPTRYGEAINIRVLPQSTMISSLEALGMSQSIAEDLHALIKKPHGIVLVTGPTGSGKTTTLYTCMNLLKDSERKIITIEDPVEYDMPRLVQMQVHSQIGFTFARALRSILRHDPDIILVGEIRDLETAETAVRTALTGHLVFSTLHTNDAASTVVRLLDMGIEPYLVASSVEAILAQRLVRMICPQCRRKGKLPKEIRAALPRSNGQRKRTFGFQGSGCTACRFTGFHGRTVITEMLMLTEKIREMTIARCPGSDIQAQALQDGMVSLTACGLEKARQGITTYEEVLRVTKGA